MTLTKSKRDVYQEVTATILEALKTADPNDWHAPWHAQAAHGMPKNVASGKAYRGANVPTLWAEQMLKGYEHALWGTYKQWSERGGQVRKGEHGTLIMFWKKLTRKDADADQDNADQDTKGKPKSFLMARGYKVFNVAQVDGVQVAVSAPKPPRNRGERDADCDAFLEGVGADVRHGGNMAYYLPASDAIQLPAFCDFDDPESYYSTSFHEHTHWTAPKSRCDRDFSGRFGSEAYAAEELVAELGAAFLCATLGVSNKPREDHARYLKSWIRVLENDPRAIVTASSKAQAAVDYLEQCAGLAPETDEGGE